MNKKVGDIIFKSVILVLLVISIFVNYDYDDVKNRKIINDIDSYNKYKSKTFVSFDLSNVIETRFIIEENDKYKTYIVNYNDISILVELSSNTVLTSEVNLIKSKDTNSSKDVKDSYIKENEGTKFISGYYTNKDIKKNEDLVSLKLKLTYAFIIGLFIFIIIDIILLFKSKNNDIKLDENINIEQ